VQWSLHVSYHSILKKKKNKQIFYILLIEHAHVFSMILGTNRDSFPNSTAHLKMENYYSESLFEEVQWLRLALSKGPNRVGVSFPSPEDGNRSRFRNFLFSSCLQFRTMNKFHKPSYSVIHHRLFRMVKSRRKRRVGHVARMGRRGRRVGYW
jgi:hypothetical protein